VTLDIDLPHASGDELMLKIKTTARMGARPRGHGHRHAEEPTDSTWAVKKGAKAYLVKPSSPMICSKPCGA
jgi:CheY-like chemotaxis protein